ncbi:cyclin-dependent protein kinase [Quaeritorhiza haematococci]|nr:cyclin-dependent protein kinase [Quaeritorhiza haematococci]
MCVTESDLVGRQMLNCVFEAATHLRLKRNAMLVHDTAKETLERFKARKDRARPTIFQKYEILGFISAGTYGRVYKARSHNPENTQEYAIKKFKPDKEGDPALQSGISQSACREIALCRELSHENIVALEEVLLDPSDRSICMVLEYAEHDFLQIIHYHGHQERKPIPEFTIKSFLWQLLNGVAYLHANWVLHRDLKPANILVNADGVVKIGDLGLARLFQRPLQPLFNGDKVVVTIWYRAPELLLGSRHYTKAIDIWAIGCIFAELLLLRPIFKGEEAKMDNKKNIPFQKDQLTKIFEVLGTPTKEKWPGLEHMPEYHNLSAMRTYHHSHPGGGLRNIFFQHCSAKSEMGYQLLAAMLEYDPAKRITAEEALSHPYFMEDPKPMMNSFVLPNTEQKAFEYPLRKLFQEEDVKGSMTAAKQAQQSKNQAGQQGQGPQGSSSSSSSQQRNKKSQSEVKIRSVKTGRARIKSPTVDQRKPTAQGNFLTATHTAKNKDQGLSNRTFGYSRLVMIRIKNDDREPTAAPNREHGQ